MRTSACAALLLNRGFVSLIIPKCQFKFEQRVKSARISPANMKKQSSILVFSFFARQYRLLSHLNTREYSFLVFEWVKNLLEFFVATLYQQTLWYSGYICYFYTKSTLHLLSVHNNFKPILNPTQKSAKNVLSRFHSQCKFLLSLEYFDSHS